MRTGEFLSDTTVRRRLALAGAVLGSAALLAACGGHESEPAASSHQLPAGNGALNDPYRAGEWFSVLPELSAKYDGSYIIFTTKALKRYLTAHGNQFVKIAAHNGPHESEQIWIENGQGLAEPNPFADRQALACDNCELTVDITTSTYQPASHTFAKTTAHRFPLFFGPPIPQL